MVTVVSNGTGSEEPRLGVAGKAQDDYCVQGMVLMRRGEKSTPTIARVEQLVQTINKSSSLRPGVRRRVRV